MRSRKEYAVSENHGKALGLTSGQFAELAATIVRHLPIDMEPRDAQFFIENPQELKRALRIMLMNAHHDVFSVSVRGGIDLHELFSAARLIWGELPDRVDAPSDGYDIEIELVSFNCDVTVEDVERHIRSRGMRAATLWELLSFAAAYPTQQERYTICAPGATWEDASTGKTVLPGIRSAWTARCLESFRCDGVFKQGTRFAAVRGSSQ